MAKSKASKTKQDKDSLMSSPTFAVQLEIPLFATAESVQPNNETTLVDKSPICNPSTQMPKSDAPNVANASLSDSTGTAKTPTVSPSRVTAVSVALASLRKAYGIAALSAQRLVESVTQRVSCLIINDH